MGLQNKKVWEALA